MPELPEVHRIAGIVRRAALGRRIRAIQSTEDPLVFADGITNEVFEEELVGRTVTNVGRYGKVFYAELDGTGRHPVMHLGMTGNMYVRGTNPNFYRSSSKKVDTQWPPRFWKFIWKMESTLTEPETELVFVDARRLGRIRLCKDVLGEPPISMLGFDPILSIPTLEEFSSKVLKRGLPIKSLLLDQTFSAGVGNWVADEILFHARIHPEQRSNNLGENQVKGLYDKMQYVCQTAVGVDADSSQFPEHWLFRHRWGKGKGNSSDLKLPSGEPALIKWITVGSRTSAFVPKVQVLMGTRGGKEGTHKEGDEGAHSSGDSSLSELEDPEEPESIKTTKKRKSSASADQPSKETRHTRKRHNIIEQSANEIPKVNRRRSSRLSAKT